MNRQRTTSLDPEGAIFRYAGPLLVVAIIALWIYTRSTSKETPAEHPHAAGDHGGVIVSLAEDRYHVEALVEASGNLRLFTLDRDETRVLEVPEQSLTAYVTADEPVAAPIPLSAAPQPGDAPGHTSQFVGLLPEELRGKPLAVSVPNLVIGEGRYRVGFAWSTAAPDGWMHAALSDDQERALYNRPAGKYTASDILANGSQPASQKYRGFRAKHDFNPQPGDAVCPISRTKANPACTWVVDGRRYAFCCPPCIDEFVTLAKERPEQIEPPESYVAEGGVMAGKDGGLCIGLPQPQP